MSANHDLFGGAFQIFLPSPVVDVSTFRQVPDNQEVFNNSSSNQSITIDILESVEATDPIEAAKLHFDAITECNDSSSSSIEFAVVQQIDGCPCAVLLRGWQKVSKFNENREDSIKIEFMLYRFPLHKTDVLVCFNDPLDSVGGSDGIWNETDVNTCLASLRLINPSIFG